MVLNSGSNLEIPGKMNREEVFLTEAGPGRGTVDGATVDSGLGPLTVKVNTPIQGPSLGATPTSGVFQVTAGDNSKLTATITNRVAALAVDTDGNGAIDGTVSASWDFLD